MKKVPSVAMIGGTWRRLMMRLLMTPTTLPAPIPKAMAAGHATPWTSVHAVVMPPSVKTDPTEKSSPPPIINSAAPQAITK